jgi:hypothetical protein
MQVKFIKKQPDSKSRDHIEGPMGEIGQAANAIDQGKAYGHQGKGKTIDDSVDEDVHRQKSDRVMGRHGDGVI